LKKETSVLVAVRVVGQEEWLEVGRVKSKDNSNIEAAVAKQRVIVAEHSRRLFPLQVAKDAKVEWAFRQTDPEEQWVVVDKSVLDGSPEGIEKDMGFEGRPDPASGFYCLYNRGSAESMPTPQTKADCNLIVCLAMNLVLGIYSEFPKAICFQVIYYST
jgi:hypothetical protein